MKSEGRGAINSAMSSATTAPEPTFAAGDVARELACWLAYLSAERRVSAKTVDAYARDVRQFLVFLCGHFGSRPTLPALSRLKPLDVRAFMAARRADGVSRRSLMRLLAGVRRLARFLRRLAIGTLGPLPPLPTPTLAKTLPPRPRVP